MDSAAQPSTKPVAPDGLATALADIVFHPWRTLVPAWSWKAATIAAFFRAAFFFATSLRQGRERAVQAMLVEAVFAIFAAGLLGATSQRLRGSHPQWATAIIVWLAMPALMVAAQVAIHHLTGTARADDRIPSSFCSTAFLSAFSWYAMNHGALLGGDDSTSVRHDAAVLPRIALDFILAVPRGAMELFRRA